VCIGRDVGVKPFQACEHPVSGSLPERSSASGQVGRMVSCRRAACPCASQSTRERGARKRVSEQEAPLTARCRWIFCIRSIAAAASASTPAVRPPRRVERHGTTFHRRVWIGRLLPMHPPPCPRSHTAAGNSGTPRTAPPAALPTASRRPHRLSPDRTGRFGPDLGRPASMTANTSAIGWLWQGRWRRDRPPCPCSVRSQAVAEVCRIPQQWQGVGPCFRCFLSRTVAVNRAPR
jgi:hypothetical protein